MRTQLQETRNIADELEKVGKYNLKKHWSHSKYFITWDAIIHGYKL